VSSAGRYACYDSYTRYNWFIAFNRSGLEPYADRVLDQTGLPVPVSRMRVQAESVKRAEKSRLTRRRKRGLRKGKRRSRECHSRRTVSCPANSSKSPSSRKVNHIGRKFIWAVKASNTLRAECERLNKYPRGQLEVGHPARAPRLKMKQHCLVKWTRLHRQATVAGIPPVAAFHDSFWKYLLVETSRGNQAADWDMLLTGLPRRKPSPKPQRSISDLFGGLNMSPRESTVSNKTEIVEERKSSIKCPYCGSLVLARRPVCQNRSCGRACREFFS